MRAINADALIADIKECIEVKDSNFEWEQVEGLEVALSCVDEQPTIEPERKTGRWEIYVISMLDGEGCKCSECGFEGVPYWDFCPNCGADMTEGEG